MSSCRPRAEIHDQPAGSRAPQTCRAWHLCSVNQSTLRYDNSSMNNICAIGVVRAYLSSGVYVRAAIWGFAGRILVIKNGHNCVRVLRFFVRANVAGIPQINFASTVFMLSKNGAKVLQNLCARFYSFKFAFHEMKLRHNNVPVNCSAGKKRNRSFETVRFARCLNVNRYDRKSLPPKTRKLKMKYPSKYLWKSKKKASCAYAISMYSADAGETRPHSDDALHQLPHGKLRSFCSDYRYNVSYKCSNNLFVSARITRNPTGFSFRDAHADVRKIRNNNVESCVRSQLRAESDMIVT